MTAHERSMVAEPKQSNPHAPACATKELLGLGLSAKEPWQPEELRALLQEELSCPLEFDLSGVASDEARRIILRAKAQGLLVRSLGELLHHPKPPLDLLMMAKDYFKLNQSHPQSELAPDVALGLYYLCIAVALWRHRARITTLERDELATAFNWIQSQEWMDVACKKAASEAAKLL